MKAIPMIFNQAMVSALVEGNKTVTRRPMKLETKDCDLHCLLKPNEVAGEVNSGNFQNSLYKPGDLIWVRETLEINAYLDGFYMADNEVLDLENRDWQYREPEYVGKVPSIHMPRWASRLTLRVTNVTCERLKNITKEQAKREGVSPTGCTKGFWVKAYQMLWDSIYSNWDKNPWVWVIEFDVLQKNIDEVLNGNR